VSPRKGRQKASISWDLPRFWQRTLLRYSVSASPLKGRFFEKHLGHFVDPLFEIERRQLAVST
jgi:hypothetical protein